VILSKTASAAFALGIKETMHTILISPMLAFDDTPVATAGAIVILILSIMALIRSKMPS